jgi:hypothetical protein
MRYLVTSESEDESEEDDDDEDSDYDEGVQVNVEEAPGGDYIYQTRSATASTQKAARTGKRGVGKGKKAR